MREDETLVTPVLFCIIIFSAINLVISSCTQRQMSTGTIISGRLPDLGSKSIVINLNGKEYSSPVDERGQFRLVLDLSSPEYLYVQNLDRKIFLLPDDSLFIGKSDGLFYRGGESALINTYYSDLDKYLKSITDTLDLKAYFSQAPGDFPATVDKAIEICKQPLLRLHKDHPEMNKEFLRLENERIKYFMYSDLNDYAQNYKAYTGKNPVIPDQFYSYLNRVNLNDITLLQFNDYMYFLTSYVYMQSARHDNSAGGVGETARMLDIIENSFTVRRIRNEVSKEIMRRQTNHLYVNDTLINRYEQLCTNPDYVTAIKRDYDILRPLLKGNKAPDFEFLDINGNKVSLKTFSGKYVLIDVWSTTCGPCLREMPALEKIKQGMNGRNIAIISACLSEEPAWKRMLSRYGLKEGQYRVENGWDSKFRADYLKISGVPVYILIDPDGFIVNARAPYPSEGLWATLDKFNL